MQVTDRETGKPYNLDMTPELKADLAAYHNGHCDHPGSEIRQRRDGGGAVHFRRQCTTCGKSIGSALKKSPELTSAPRWQEELENAFQRARDDEYGDIIQKHVRKQRDGDEGFRREYDLYLETPEWRVKRRKVLNRANGMCEGCLDRKATQVHHLTYKHVFREFMFELVAICDECHDRMHAQKPDETSPDSDSDQSSEWEDGHPCEGCRHASEQNNRRWCFISDQYAADALAPGGDCGPKHFSFEPLR